MPRDATSCVRAVVRVRPLLRHELQRGEEDCCEVRDANSILIQTGPHKQWRQYTFDACLEGAKSQKQLFQECGVIHLMDSALQGYSATVLAYGQTGSGKTHTMMGRSEKTDAATQDVKREDGMIMRSAKRLFKRISAEAAESGSTFAVSASFTEIYNAPGAVNECICDLLSPEAAGKNLNVRYNQKNGFYISDLCVVDCGSIADVRAVVDAGIQNRRVGAHALNKDSSRSHALFTMYIDSECVVDDGGGDGQRSKRFGKITFLDLAGSERLKESLAEGHARKETQAINKSLFTLGQVISQLSQGKSEKHIPYRNSKLTQLLQESFGGEALCLMVTCISPAAIFAEESLNSLNYAQKAMTIRNRPVIRLDEKQQVLMDLKSENAALRREVEAYRAKFGALSPRMSLTESGALGMTQAPAVRDVEPEASPSQVEERISVLSAAAASYANAVPAASSSRPVSGAAEDRPGRSAARLAREVDGDASAGSRGRSEPPTLPAQALEQGSYEATPDMPSPPAPVPLPPTPHGVSPAKRSAGGGYAMAAQRRRGGAERTRQPPPAGRRNGPAKECRSLPPLPGRVGSKSSQPDRRDSLEEDMGAASARPSPHRQAADGSMRRQLMAANGLEDRTSPPVGGSSLATPSKSARTSTQSVASEPTPSLPSRPAPAARTPTPDGGDELRPNSGHRPPRSADRSKATVQTIAAPPSTKARRAVASTSAASAVGELSRSESNRELKAQHTRKQLEHLDTAHWSEWQFNFDGEGDASGTHPERRGGSRPNSGARRQSNGSGGSSSRSSSGSPSSANSEGGGGGAGSAASSTAASCSRRASQSQEARGAPAASPAPQVPDDRPQEGDGFQHMSLAELNSKLSSMLPTSALLQEDGARGSDT